MSATPAARLARAKVTYQDWQISRRPDKWFQATRRDAPGEGRILMARTVDELMVLLHEAEPR